jgi:hypothetical protein
MLPIRPSLEQVSSQIISTDLQVLGDFIEDFGQRTDLQLFVGRDRDVMFDTLRPGTQAHMTAGLPRNPVTVLTK